MESQARTTAKTAQSTPNEITDAELPHGKAGSQRRLGLVIVIVAAVLTAGLVAWAVL